VAARDWARAAAAAERRRGKGGEDEGEAGGIWWGGWRQAQKCDSTGGGLFLSDPWGQQPTEGVSGCKGPAMRAVSAEVQACCEPRAPGEHSATRRANAPEHLIRQNDRHGQPAHGEWPGTGRADTPRLRQRGAGANDRRPCGRAIPKRGPGTQGELPEGRVVCVEPRTTYFLRRSEGRGGSGVVH
jgi:hypothetical protein